MVSAAKHAAVAPRTFLCAGLGAAMVRRATAPSTPKLSGREEQVLYLLADGLGTGEIAAQLYMSESTAKTHITHIYQKLGAPTARRPSSRRCVPACSTTWHPMASDRARPTGAPCVAHGVHPR